MVDFAHEGTAKYENGKIYMHYGADLDNPRGQVQPSIMNMVI